MTIRSDNWWDKAGIRNYEAAKVFFLSCRNKAKGKPLRAWARLYMEGDTVVFYFGQQTGGMEFARLTPDNIFTFTSEPHHIRAICANTFASSLYGAVPFMWQRVGIARYRVEHTSMIPKLPSHDLVRKTIDWGYMRASAPEYFKGIQFNMLTGECINKRPDVNETVNHSNRKAWLSALRKFKYGIKARARVGTFAPLVEVENKVAHRNMPDWSDPVWLNLLYTSIKDNQYPMELLRGFVGHAVHADWHSHHGNVSPDHVIKAVDSVCNTYSLDLRKKFGVFDEMSTVQEADELLRHTMAGSGACDATPMAV